MSRKRQRKKQYAVSVPPPSKVAFTLAAVRMLRDALRLVDETFARNTKPLPHIKLGLETVEGLKRKLDDMLQREEWDYETPFDYNEMHILYAAIHMYLADLTMDNDQHLMPTCLHLCKQLSTIMETIPPKQLKAHEND